MTCCPIAERPDIREIDTALARGEGYRKVRADANARGETQGLSPIPSDWAMRLHRDHVLARMGSAGDAPEGEEPAVSDVRCCVVVDRPDADEVDAALRAGESHRRVHEAAMARHPELKVNEVTIYRHKKHLEARDKAALQVPRSPATPHPPEPRSPATPTRSPATPTPPEPRSPATPARSPATPDGAGAESEPDESAVIPGGSGLTATKDPPRPLACNTHSEAAETPQPPMESTTSLARAGARVARPMLEEEIAGKVLEQVSRLLTAGAWSGLSTVEALSQKYGVPFPEVERIHALAANKVKEARGGFVAQHEAAVAASHWIWKDESETAAHYREEARRLFEAKDYVGARTASKMAQGSARLALDARKHHDALTVLNPKSLAVRISPMTRPDVEEIFGMLRLILDGLFGPGAAERVETAIGIWDDTYAATESDDQSRDAAMAWVAQERATITVTGEAIDVHGRAARR